MDTTMSADRASQRLGRRLRRRKAIGLALAATLAVLMLVSAPPAIGAGQPCRVRNVTHDTSGDSLIRMAEAAVDGDRLWVRGTCRGEIVIRADIVISGVGGATLTGRDKTRVVRIEPGARVTLRDLIIAHGRVGGGGYGGGLHNRGTLVIVDSVLRHNRALGAGDGGAIAARGSRTTLRRTVVTRNEGDIGGGILADGVVTVLDSLVSRNHGWAGGGINNVGGRVTVIRSTIEGNTADAYGGGIYNEGGALTIDSSTVSNNDSDLRGGGVFNTGSATLTDSTVSGNVSSSGGGIDNVGMLGLVGSSVTSNTAEEGGGILNEGGTVTLGFASSATGNVPDDCVGTPGC